MKENIVMENYTVDLPRKRIIHALKRVYFCTSERAHLKIKHIQKHCLRRKLRNLPWQVSLRFGLPKINMQTFLRHINKKKKN